MQIGSGQSALSLALFKALGSQPGASSGASEAAGADSAAAKAAAAKEAVVKTAGGPEAPGVTTRVPAPVSADSCGGGGCTPPRGSFVDLRA